MPIKPCACCSRTFPAAQTATHTTKLLLTRSTIYTRPRLRLVTGLYDCAKHKDRVGVGARRVAAHPVLRQQHLPAADQQHLADGRDPVLLLDLLL